MIAVALVNSAPAFAMQTVPAGNRHAEQPDIPGASIRRTKGTKSSFDLKYEKVHVPRGFARVVGNASSGRSGQGCRG